ncbi:MAG: DUF4421 family protein [Paludibacteraceae bacterium]|nr:DUF4421 family protein [Paludibacteraceae bacterium]
MKRSITVILLLVISLANAQVSSAQSEKVGFIQWVEKTFFGFDSTYVYSYPTRLTLTLQNRTWRDMYTFDIDKENELEVKSNYLSDFSFSIGYSFLSLGYTLGMNKLTGDKDSKYDRFDLSLKCNMLALDLSSATNESETTLSATHDNQKSTYPFYGLKMEMREGSLTYYFKYLKYSNEAAYSSCYPYRQIKNAGSPIIGIYYGEHDITCDLTKIPDEIELNLHDEEKTKQIRNRDICLNGGYGYNFVFAKGWLLNGTALPSIGLRIHDDESSSKYQLATNSKIKGACTYNSRYFFGGLTFQYSTYWYITKGYTIKNSIGACTINLGVRL